MEGSPRFSVGSVALALTDLPYVVAEITGDAVAVGAAVMRLKAAFFT
jgi:hypothetical protein